MPTDQISSPTHTDAINRGFSKQSVGYDEADSGNIILQDLRQQVYRHVQRYLRPASHILELNAGTGIDAMFFVSQGHYVHATDLSDGMISQIQKKISTHHYANRLTCQQLSFEDLHMVSAKNYDYVFSNFGGLNCIPDLSRVTRHLPPLLKPGGYVTWVIMPPVCPWEILWTFKGQWRKAFRRLQKGGTMAHVESEFFRTHYHSLSKIRAALGPAFKLIRSEGLAVASPQPHHNIFPVKNPRLYKLLRRIDATIKDYFPFNRWGDHLIVTFQYTGDETK